MSADVSPGWKPPVGFGLDGANMLTAHMATWQFYASHIIPLDLRTGNFMVLIAKNGSIKLPISENGGIKLPDKIVASYCRSEIRWLGEDQSLARLDSQE